MSEWVLVPKEPDSVTLAIIVDEIWARSDIVEDMSQDAARGLYRAMLAAAAPPPPADAEVADLVKRLSEPLLVDAFERGIITSSVLAERLIKTAKEAAAMLQLLSAPHGDDVERVARAMDTLHWAHELCQLYGGKEIMPSDNPKLDIELAINSIPRLSDEKNEENIKKIAQAIYYTDPSTSNCGEALPFDHPYGGGWRDRAMLQARAAIAAMKSAG